MQRACSIKSPVAKTCSNMQEPWRFQAGQSSVLFPYSGYTCYTCSTLPKPFLLTNSFLMSTLLPRARLHFLIHATHLKDVVPFYTARSQWRRVLDQIWSQQSFRKVHGPMMTDPSVARKSLPTFEKNNIFNKNYTS